MKSSGHTSEEKNPTPEATPPSASTSPLRRRIIRADEVMNRTGLSRTTIYRMRRAGLFPQPIQRTAQGIGWYEDAVDDWVNHRPPSRE